MRTLAAKVKHFLDYHRVAYRILHHERTNSLEEAAQFLEIDPAQVLKTILLKDSLGFVLAILPLPYQIDLAHLGKQMNRSFEEVSCHECDKFFKDCEPGVHTPFGEIYGIPLILENTIKKLQTVYLEAGSQNALIQLSMDDFQFLTTGAPYFSFAFFDQNLVPTKKKKEYTH